MDKRYDSDEEKYFEWYLKELQNAGFCTYEFGSSIDISNGIDNLMFNFRREVMNKSKKNPKKITENLSKKILTIERHYTPDYVIHWNEKAEGIFVLRENSVLPLGREFLFVADENWTSVIDVKPTKQNPKHSYRFGEKQAMVFLATGIFVQKVVPLGKNGMFEKTFTPTDYFFTDVRKQLRKIDFKTRTLTEYLQ